MYSIVVAHSQLYALAVGMLLCDAHRLPYSNISCSLAAQRVLPTLDLAVGQERGLGGGRGGMGAPQQCRFNFVLPKDTCRLFYFNSSFVSGQPAIQRMPLKKYVKRERKTHKLHNMKISKLWLSL